MTQQILSAEEIEKKIKELDEEIKKLLICKNNYLKFKMSK